MDEVTTFPTLRAKRHPIKAKLAGDNLADLSIPAMIRANCSDVIEEAFMKLVTLLGIEIAEEVYQDVADRVVERMRNANVGG